jgi:hypothetical protein
MAKSRSRSSTPKRTLAMQAREFICVGCNSTVFTFSDSEPERDRCYNCTFIKRVADTPEQEAELRKLLDCEWQEREDSDDNSGVR